MHSQEQRPITSDGLEKGDAGQGVKMVDDDEVKHSNNHTFNDLQLKVRVDWELKYTGHATPCAACTIPSLDGAGRVQRKQKIEFTMEGRNAKMSVQLDGHFLTVRMIVEGERAVSYVCVVRMTDVAEAKVSGFLRGTGYVFDWVLVARVEYGGYGNVEMGIGENTAVGDEDVEMGVESVQHDEDVEMTM